MALDTSGNVMEDYMYGVNRERKLSDSEYSYFISDGQGSIVLHLDDEGNNYTNNPSWYRYDAYGQSLTGSSSSNQFRYRGEFCDNETGFIYLRGRYYNPDTGSFISEDPVKDGSNWYAYCGGDPVNFVDPSGYITQEEIQMYENGEMAPMAYTYLINLTYQWYLADTEESKDVYHQLAEDFRANDYKTTNGAFPNVDAGIEYMPSMFFGEPTKEQHYFRNQLNLNFSWNQYTILQERLPENMKWNDKVAADYHQNHTVNNQPNKKYVSFDGHFELVYNDNNILLTEHNNPHDMGTYNYAHPTKDPIGHGIKDVKPYGAIWIKWGNILEHAGTIYK